MSADSLIPPSKPEQSTKETSSKVLLEQPGLETWLDESFLAEEASALFSELESTLPWRQESIQLFGRTVAIPRLQSWHGDPGASYRYSGLDLEPEPWTPLLAELRARLETVELGAQFNSVLANLYRDGQDSMGWHADDEPELGAEPVIASLSLGETRTFQLRHRTDRSIARIDLDLPSGSLLWMAGKTQTHWQHALPKRGGKRRTWGARINLTFRRIYSPAELDAQAL